MPTRYPPHNTHHQAEHQKGLIQMMKRLDPANTAMKHHFLPMEVQAHYADPKDQAAYDLARWELENQETE
jgi:hypothetical protein